MLPARLYVYCFTAGETSAVTMIYVYSSDLASEKFKEARTRIGGRWIWHDRNRRRCYLSHWRGKLPTWRTKVGTKVSFSSAHQSVKDHITDVIAPLQTLSHLFHSRGRCVRTKDRVSKSESVDSTCIVDSIMPTNIKGSGWLIGLALVVVAPLTAVQAQSAIPAPFDQLPQCAVRAEAMRQFQAPH